MNCKKTIKSQNAPIVIITSNNEKELPDAFCVAVFSLYTVSERHTMVDIINVHYPKLEEDLMEEALKVFYGLREIHGIKKETYNFGID